VTDKFNLLSSIIQVSFPNCVQFDLPASLQIILEEGGKKKSNENRQFKPNPVYHYLYVKSFFVIYTPINGYGMLDPSKWIYKPSHQIISKASLLGTKIIINFQKLCKK